MRRHDIFRSTGRSSWLVHGTACWVACAHWHCTHDMRFAEAVLHVLYQYRHLNWHHLYMYLRSRPADLRTGSGTGWCLTSGLWSQRLSAVQRCTGTGVYRVQLSAELELCMQLILMMQSCQPLCIDKHP